MVSENGGEGGGGEREDGRASVGSWLLGVAVALAGGFL